MSNSFKDLAEGLEVFYLANSSHEQQQQSCNSLPIGLNSLLNAQANSYTWWHTPVPTEKTPEDVTLEDVDFGE